jgi:hypothetical protein
MDEDVENANPCDLCQADPAAGRDRFGFRCMDCHDNHTAEVHGLDYEGNPL